MAKLGIFASILSICTVLGYATIASSPAQAGDECKRTAFKTKMVKEACAKGGQKAAKDAMKVFLKEAKAKLPAKVTGCPSCHGKVGGDYPLKPTALALFKEAGGVILDDKAGAPPPAAPPATPPAAPPAKAPAPAAPPAKAPAAPPATAK